MKHFYKIILASVILLGSLEINAQSVMSFEDQSTTQNCSTVSCNYTSSIPANSPHELVNVGGIPVNSSTNTSMSPALIGFRSFFRPTRTGGSSDGLTDGDFFGYAGPLTINNNFSQAATEGDQIFMVEDTDGEVTMLFDPVSLVGANNSIFTMDYIVSGGFEFSDSADDYLYIGLNVTDCAASTTVVLVEAFGAPSGGDTDLDALTDNVWIPVSQNLSAYSNCRVQLEIITDTNSSTEEMGFDNIVFSEGTTLPVEFINFTALPREKAVDLRWATATETENRGFSVERSMDATNFQPIGWVDGNGNSAEQLNYSYEDLTISAGQQYFYRLRQEDIDGTYAYSAIVSVQTSGTPEHAVGRLFPNPAQNGISNLEIFARQSGDWEISFLDLSGRIINNTVQTLPEGYNLLPIDLQQLPRGTYLVRVVGEGTTQLKRIIR